MSLLGINKNVVSVELPERNTSRRRGDIRDLLLLIVVTLFSFVIFAFLLHFSVRILLLLTMSFIYFGQFPVE